MRHSIRAATFSDASPILSEHQPRGSSEVPPRSRRVGAPAESANSSRGPDPRSGPGTVVRRGESGHPRSEEPRCHQGRSQGEARAIARRKGYTGLDRADVRMGRVPNPRSGPTCEYVVTFPDAEGA